MTTRAIDPTFLALPLDRLADVALEIAKRSGATYADFRVERLRSHIIVTEPVTLADEPVLQHELCQRG